MDSGCDGIMQSLSSNRLSLLRYSRQKLGTLNVESENSSCQCMRSLRKTAKYQLTNSTSLIFFSLPLLSSITPKTTGILTMEQEELIPNPVEIPP